MIASDPFSQFIAVPDDQPVLPPVDEEVCGLQDLLGFCDPQVGQSNGPSGGLLLGTDTLDEITLSPNSHRNEFLLTYDPLFSYANLFPPALSPDSSPISVASTSWPRTPEADTTLIPASLTPVGTLWDIAGIEEESCSTSIHFLDQSGNSLEDLPSQIPDVMPEDIACTRQVVPDGSLFIATDTPLSNTPVFVVSQSPGTSPSLQTEAASFEQVQSLFECSPVCYPRTLPARPVSPPLSRLNAISLSSRSPRASPNPSPLINCSLPALSLASPSNSDEEIGEIDLVSSTPSGSASGKSQLKRNADTLDEDTPPWKIQRRWKTKNIDEEEWSPDSERVKHPRAVSSSQSTRQMATSISSCFPGESSDRATGQGSETYPDATQTTCQICGQGFTRTSDYVRHIENSASHPETRKMWPCPYCNSALGRKDALGRHIKTLHPGEIIIIPEGIPGSRLRDDQKEPFVQRMGQRKTPPRRQLRRGTRGYR